MPATPDDPNATRSQPQGDETRDHSPPPETGTHPPDPDATASGTAPEVAAFANRLQGLAGAGSAAPDAIPGYEILGELGRGGMGVVYKARQLGLNREVALKTVLRADLPRTSAARFWVEAEVMAAVKHPHVVQVFELGEHAGRPFLAMELAAGGSLADRLRASGGRESPVTFSPHAAAELLEKIARGVAAAHELGIVHRDLKPANVLLASPGREPGEVPVPKVTDFGLAKWRSTDLTQTQAVMGTPAYMAPEQAAGRAKFVGPAADVWALGVILYECVAGKRPFAGDTAEVLLSQIQSAEPTALRTQVRGVPRDLDTIVAKCLAKEPEHRYPTAAELADDLARFARGEPIAARPVGRIERLARWVRRKPTAAAAYGLSALAVVLALVTFVIAGFWREAEGAKKDAEGARDEADRLRGIADAGRAEEVRLNGIAKKALLGEAAAKREVERERERLSRFNYGRTIQLAYQAWRDDQMLQARELLAGTREDLRGWEYDYVHRLCNSDLVTLSHRGGVHSALFSHDGDRALTIMQAGKNGRVVHIWDAHRGEVIATLGDDTDFFIAPHSRPTGSGWSQRVETEWPAFGMHGAEKNSSV